MQFKGDFVGETKNSILMVMLDRFAGLANLLDHFSAARERSPFTFNRIDTLAGNIYKSHTRLSV